MKKPATIMSDNVERHMKAPSDDIT